MILTCDYFNCKQQGLYLNFSAWFIKKWVSFKTQKVNVVEEWHFVENKTEIMQHVLKMQ
jgi:hypothetical protein